MISPPNSGPRKGPISTGVTMKLMAQARSRLSKERSSMRRPTGVVMAPPNPCKARAASRLSRFCDAPQSAEPSMNRPSAPQNRRLAPIRSASQPLIGMKTARLSV